MKNPVERYYDSVAGNYDKNMSKFLIAHFKEAEKKQVLKLLNARKNEMILDAGCGTGFYSKEIDFQGANVYATDISKKMVKMINQKRIKTEHSDLHKLNL